MVAGGLGHDADFVAVEAEDFRIGDQVIAMLVMTAAADEAADLVQQAGHLQQETMPRREPVLGLQFVEEPRATSATVFACRMSARYFCATAVAEWITPSCTVGSC